jgi:hypothetical protein
VTETKLIVRVGVGFAPSTGKWYSLCHFRNERRSEEFDTKEEAQEHARIGAERLQTIARAHESALEVLPLMPDVTLAAAPESDPEGWWK